jgi:Family of unknown function (DUF6459)
MPQTPPELTGQPPELTEVPLLPARRNAPRGPLPDATAIRRVLVPDSAPPFDDEVAGHDNQDAAPAQLPGLACEQSTPPEETEPAHTEPAHTEPGHAEPGHAGPTRTDPTQAEPWPGRFAQVLAETLAGARPPQQLTPWTTEQARRRIRQLGPLLSTAQRPRVRRLVASAPVPGVVEMTVIVNAGPRLRAIAVRLERSAQAGPRSGAGQQWICTAVEAA